MLEPGGDLGGGKLEKRQVRKHFISASKEAQIGGGSPRRKKAAETVKLKKAKGNKKVR